MAYAIVKVGGSQTKVNIDDIVVTNRLKDANGKVLEDGTTAVLPAVLYVDGDKVVSDASKLSKVKVEAKVIRQERGKKIVAMKYKNKTGYKKRWGHRQELTRLKITTIKAA